MSMKHLKVRMAHALYVFRGHTLQFLKYCILFSEDQFFFLANIADLDEMPHDVAFYMGL